MFKLLKTFAPVVLALFFFAGIVAPAFGEDTIKSNDNPDVTYSIQYKDGQPQINKEFKIVVKAGYKGEPLYNLQPRNNWAFEAVNASDGTPIFQLKAPSKPGTYACSFEGMTSDGGTLRFNIPIKVYSEKGTSLNGGFIACVITGAVLCGGMGYAIGQLGNDPWPLALLGAGGGATVGAMIGILLFPDSKENNK